MYSVGTDTTVESLISRLETTTVEAPDYTLSVEVAAKLLGVKWASGGMGGPILCLKGGITTRDGADMLDNMDEALKVAEAMGADIPFLLFRVATDLGKWSQGRSPREAVPYAMASILLTIFPIKAEADV